MVSRSTPLRVTVVALKEPQYQLSLTIKVSLDPRDLAGLASKSSGGRLLRYGRNEIIATYPYYSLIPYGGAAAERGQFN